MRLFLLAVLTASLNAEARASGFACEAHDMISVDVIGNTKSEEGYPLEGELLINIEGAAYFIDPTEITLYRNERLDDGAWELQIEIFDQVQESLILSLEQSGSAGRMTIDFKGVQLDDVAAYCYETD